MLELKDPGHNENLEKEVTFSVGKPASGFSCYLTVEQILIVS